MPIKSYWSNSSSSICRHSHTHASQQQLFASRPPPCSGDLPYAPIEFIQFFLRVGKVGLTWPVTEINDSQHEAWYRQIEAFDEDARRHTQLFLFPADRTLPEHAKAHGVQVRLEAMELHRPRQWGACWLACQLYEQLGLNRFWGHRLRDSREGTCWPALLHTLRF